MTITGAFLVGGEDRLGAARFAAINPATGEALAPDFGCSGAGDVADACRLAAEAFDGFRELAPTARASFLEEIAVQIEAIGDELIDRAMLETGLPQARLLGERGRTTGQLRLFAAHLRESDWMRITLDSPLPDRSPLPRPDLRQRRIAIGPAGVFGASNFPLAFSVAGGDTASALAAGCPVVCKGHPAHPGTSELVARAIRRAVAACNLHEGVFSLLAGPGHELGLALANDPRIKAIGFTGSRAGGLALLAAAQARPEPIPVFAEMASVNPVILMPAALAARAEDLAKEAFASITMGAGQFCTNPGLILGLAGPDFERFAGALARLIAEAPGQTMLTPGIHASFDRGVDALSARTAAWQIAHGRDATAPNQCRPALFRTDAQAVIADPGIASEVFGASSVLVETASLAELTALIETLEGQLTITLHIDSPDHADAAKLLPLLERKAGRILANAWPTGVEVCHAMVHGGPFPATSDSRSTSVGTAAIERFLRPVCYQDIPDAILPDALKTANPLALARTLDGQIAVHRNRLGLDDLYV